MESHYKRQGDPEHSLRLENTVPEGSTPNGGKEPCNGSRRTTPSDSGSEETVGKGSHTSHPSPARASSLQHIPEREERRITATDLEPQNSKQLHPLHPFQNGKLERSEKPYQAGRLASESRPEGRLLHSAPTPRIAEVHQIQMGGNDLRVPMPMFRPRTGTQTFHKIIESPHVVTQKTEHQIDNLSGRHSPVRSFEGGNRDGQGLSTLPVTKSRVCYKLGEISIGPHKGDRIPRNDHKQCANDYLPHRGESNKAHEDVQESIDFQKHDVEEIEQIDRETGRHGTSHHSMHVTNQIPSTNTYTIHPPRELLRSKGGFGSAVQKGTVMVGGEPPIKTGKTYINNSPGPNYPLRRSENRGVGSRMPQSGDRGTMVQEGEGPSYKQPGTDCSRFSSKNIHKDVPRSKEHTPESGQHNSSSVHHENGGDKKCGPHRKNQGAMGTIIGEGDHSYCRIPPLGTQQGSRLPVSSCGRPKRLEIKPTSFPVNLRDIGNTLNRSICLKGFVPVETIHESKTRPPVSGSRRVPAGLVKSFPVRLPSFQLSGESPSKGEETQNRYGIGSTGMGCSTMVSKTAEHVSSRAYSIRDETINTNKPQGRDTPVGKQSNFTTSSMADIRPAGKGKEFSTRVNKLITACRSEGTRTNYNSAWTKFRSWCSEEQIDPIHCSVDMILEYLAHMFYDCENEYRTINGHRSAISAFHEKIDGKPAGEHPEVCALLKGVSNERPPQPRHTYIWDVDVVLKLLASWGKNNALSDQLITYKLASLFALTSAHRGAELKLLNVQRMDVEKDQVRFQFDKKFKTTKPGVSPNASVFYKFVDDPSLCPLLCLKVYLNRSQDWRGVVEGKITRTDLFLSHQEPHHEVGKTSISRWIKDVLHMASIDTKTFTGHSYRHASSSKACYAGLPIQEILKQGNWSNRSTFERFYHQPIESGTKKFQQAVLTTKGNK